MISKIVRSAVAVIALTSTAMTPSLAAGSAQSTSVKFGYFNLALVKASFPEAAGSESLRVLAENQLRRDVEEGNKKLQIASDATPKKSKEEIEKMARELQVEINAKQQALIELVQRQSAMAAQAIAGAVASVAKDKGLDVVIDSAAVFAGGDKIVNNGEDITSDVVNKLQPHVITKPATPATK